VKYVKCESILIIEDDEAIRTSLSDVLVSEGYKIHDAANGKVAFEILETLNDSSLLLLDLMMPAMNGYEFSAAIKKMPKYSKHPIVIMSASRDGEQYAKQEGYPFLKKPLDVEGLLELVAKYCIKN
jgi:CheY-like chemotaxis protein